MTGARGGDVVTSDGPYAETKEALTGFYLIEAADLDEALRIAAEIPAAWDGAVEVRPSSNSARRQQTRPWWTVSSTPGRRWTRRCGRRVHAFWLPSSALSDRYRLPRTRSRGGGARATGLAAQWGA